MKDTSTLLRRKRDLHGDVTSGQEAAMAGPQPRLWYLISLSRHNGRLTYKEKRGGSWNIRTRIR